MDTRYPMSAGVALRLGDSPQALPHGIPRGPSDLARKISRSHLRSNVGDAPIYAGHPTRTHAPDEVLAICPRTARTCRHRAYDCRTPPSVRATARRWAQ